METKKQDKKQAKTKPLANLPVVTLSDNEMSVVQGGIILRY